MYRSRLDYWTLVSVLISNSSNTDINEFRSEEASIALMPTVTQLWEMHDSIKNFITITNFNSNNDKINDDIAAKLKDLEDTLKSDVYGAIYTKFNELLTSIHNLRSAQFFKMYSIPNKERDYVAMLVVRYISLI